MNKDNNFIFENLNSSKGSGTAFSFYMMAYVLISFVGQTLVGAIFGVENANNTFIFATFPIITFLLTILFFKSKTNQPLIKLVGVKKFESIYLFLAIVISISMMFGLGFMNDAFVKLLNKWGANISGVNIPLNTFTDFLLCIITFAVLPAIFEELFFRGLMLNLLKGVKPVYVILGVGLCFALYHCSLAQFLYQFIYGVTLTCLAMACGSVIPCIITHFINNFVVIILEYYKVPLDLYNLLYITFGVVFLALAFVFMVFAIRKSKMEKTDNIGKFFAFASVGIFVCVLFALTSLIEAMGG